MPADDYPTDAIRRHFELEDASVSPVSRVVARVLSYAPLPYPFDKIIDGFRDRLSGDGGERIQLYLETIAERLKEQDRQISELTASIEADAAGHRQEILKDLLIDGARKAEATRAKDRVKRIGLILANAAIDRAEQDADDIEEMMRTARDLSDRDVLFLRELLRISEAQFETRDRIERFQAYQLWESGFWGRRLDPEIDSVFSKLEAYGLVGRLAPPNNLNATADFQNRYVLLRKGLRFAHFIRNAH